MPTTIDCEFGDIVLVPFPFTDQTAAKKRPAVVASGADLIGRLWIVQDDRVRGLTP